MDLALVTIDENDDDGEHIVHVPREPLDFYADVQRRS